MAIEKEIKTRIVHKHDTETNWNKATGFVPKAAELIVYDKDANHPWVRFKIGDGQTSVVNLPFMYDGKPSVTAFGIVSATLPRYPSAADTAKYAQIARQNTLAFQQNIVAKRTAAGEYPSYPIFREIYFPGGTYPFDDTITISENCGIELSQDTILHFLQTNKNCIEMDRSASIDGHHGLIKVGQDFKASVISVDTSLDNAGHTVPPYYKADPMWKSARMIKDVHIVKMHTSGFCAPCNTVNKSYTTAAGKAEMAAQIGGIGLHMKTTYNGGDIWTANISGMRIAGAFSYGINIENIDNTESGYGDSKDPAWNHDMRLEATILSAEVGIRVFNCNPAHLNLTIEPGSSIDIYNDSYTEVVAAGVPYSKNGIVLEHCTNIDLGSTIVWDWDEGKTLYNPNTEEGRKNSHLAIYGACPGLILSDLLYSEKGASVLDVRQLIYTDTPKNLKTMSILQESVMRWFSPAKENILDGSGQVIGEKIVPNFNVTDEEVYRLVTEEDLAEIVEENQQIPTFTNYAKDNYLVGSRLVGSTGGLDNSAGYGEYYLTVDFIPFTQDTTLYFENFYIPTNTVETGQCVINFYDANKNAIYEGNYTLGQSFSWKVGNDSRWYLNLDYEALENNVWSIKTLSLPSNKKNTGKWPQVAYLRVCSGKSVNKNPETIIVTDSPIEYVTVGKLAEGITISQSQIRDLNFEDTGATSITTTGDGNAVTSASYDASTRKITLTKGSTFNNYEHPEGSAPSKTSGLYKFSTDASSHISGVTAVTKSDITALGIPGSDTTYSAGTGLALSGTTINHTNTVAAKTGKNQETAAPGYGGTFKVTEPLYDATGHITGINTATITMPAAQTIPSALKNPYALSINGTEYDGSKAVEIDTRKFIVNVVTDDYDNSTVDKTYNELLLAFGQGKEIVCALNHPMFNGYLPLTLFDEDAKTFAFILSPSPTMLAMVQIMRVESTTIPVAMVILSDVTINGVMWDGMESVDFTDTINDMIDASVENKKFAKKAQGIFYIIGDSTTEGVWTGTSQEITEYFDGLTIAYKTNVAGISGGSTLNINNLGDIPVKRNASTAVTTTYPVGSIIILTYSDGNWLTADYDANTKNTAGSSNKTATKLYLTGATSQTSSGTTTYSNKNCYIGTDNCLYSGGKKTVTVDDSLKNPNSFIINDITYDGSKEIKFDAMPLGGTLLSHTFVVSALSDAKTHRTLMSLGEQNAFLFQVTNLETEAQQFFTINDQGSYLTNLRVDEPVNDNNAATKKYVDDKIGAIENGLY